MQPAASRAEVIYGTSGGHRSGLLRESRLHFLRRVALVLYFHYPSPCNRFPNINFVLGAARQAQCRPNLMGCWITVGWKMSASKTSLLGYPNGPQDGVSILFDQNFLFDDPAHQENPSDEQPGLTG